MPYINKNARLALATSDKPQDAGELNYLFTKIADEYLTRGKNYQRMNDVIGALEGAKLELYRRVAAPYEDTKIIQNGDVYSDRLRVIQGQAEKGTAPPEPHSTRPTDAKVPTTSTEEQEETNA